MDGGTLILATGFTVTACLVGLRWAHIREERDTIRRMKPAHDDLRFESRGSDEDDQFFYGKIIDRLRAHLIGGRIEINWQFAPQYIHRGFWLTGKCRRNDGPWEDLPFKPYQDSGAWHESFNLYESRDYLFEVTKPYRFFFGIFNEEASVEVFDQISFAVRKGKFLREIESVINDKTNVLSASARYTKQLTALRSLNARGRERSVPPETSKSGAVSKLESRHQLKREVAEYVARETAVIVAQPWDEARKQAEIETLEQLAEQTILEAET